jgi:hypothetical protein
MAKKIIHPKQEGHPFKIGKKYQNRDGEYHVLSINEPNMVIQYLDGRTVESAITLQARIWENIQEDDQDFELDPD